MQLLSTTLMHVRGCSRNLFQRVRCRAALARSRCRTEGNCSFMLFLNGHSSSYFLWSLYCSSELQPNCVEYIEVTAIPNQSTRSHGRLCGIELHIPRPLNA